MNGVCRLCTGWDGRVCAGEVTGMGGIGSGSSFKNNVSALSRPPLNMSLMHEVKIPSTSASWLGHNLDTPVAASPIGGAINVKDAAVNDT